MPYGAMLLIIGSPNDSIVGPTLSPTGESVSFLPRSSQFYPSAVREIKSFQAPFNTLTA